MADGDKIGCFWDILELLIASLSMNYTRSPASSKETGRGERRKRAIFTPCFACRKQGKSSVIIILHFLLFTSSGYGQKLPMAKGDGQHVHEAFSGSHQGWPHARFGR
ncbi:MAG: hypothetical protein ACI3YF_09370 [Prevotella sp.]